MLFCLQYRCLGSVVMNDGTPFAAWISRDGETMKYWGGASSRRNFYCACGETGEGSLVKFQRSFKFLRKVCKVSL